MKTNKLLILTIILGVMACSSSEEILPGLTDQELVSQAKQALQIEFAQGETQQTVQTDLVLPLTVSEVTVSWNSNQPATITNTGVVSRPEYSIGDQEVTLTATITKGAENDTKVFNLTVIAMDITDQELVNQAKESLVITYREGEDASSVKNDLELSEQADNEVSISWASEDEDLISNQGVVRRPSLEQGNQEVTLTATLTSGQFSDVVSYELTVIAHEFSVNLTNSLLADYSFNDQSADDLSGNANHGTLVSTVASMDRFQNENAALAFDGIASRVDLPDGLLLQGSISISLWMKTSAGGCLIAHQTNQVGSSSPQWVPVLYVREDDALNAGFWTGATGTINDNTDALNDDQWHHIVIIGDTGFQELYIDNVLVGSGSGLRVLAGMVHNQLGNGHTNGGWPSAPNSVYPFEGSIDDVKIYYRTLNISEIESLYKSKDSI